MQKQLLNHIKLIYQLYINHNTVPNVAHISPSFHPYIIKIKAIFQKFDCGTNLKIWTPPHIKIVSILNCIFSCVDDTPSFPLALTFLKASLNWNLQDLKRVICYPLTKKKHEWRVWNELTNIWLSQRINLEQKVFPKLLFQLYSLRP